MPRMAVEALGPELLTDKHGFLGVEIFFQKRFSILYLKAVRDWKIGMIAWKQTL